METAESWETFNNLYESLKIPDTNHFILLQGYFGHIPHNTVPPKEVYSVSSAVEEAVRKNFSGLDIIAMQTPPESFFEETEEGPLYRMYQSVVAVTRGDVAKIFMNVSKVHPKAPIPVLPYGFIACFPVGDHEENSKEIIRSIWPLIDGFEATATPNVFEGELEQDFGPGGICIAKDKKIIATGLPAVSKLGLHLPEKRVDYLGGYTA